jgi:4-hydroxybenzoate polyprenyltransferase
MFWVAGFDILYSLQDMEFDKNEKLHSIPALVGEKGALFISKMFHVFAVVFWALFVAYAKLGFFAWLAVIVGAVMLYYEHRLVNRDFKNIPKAFFDVNGFLGIIFLILIILDKV